MTTQLMVSKKAAQYTKKEKGFAEGRLVWKNLHHKLLFEATKLFTNSMKKVGKCNNFSLQHISSFCFVCKYCNAEKWCNEKFDNFSRNNLRYVVRKNEAFFRKKSFSICCFTPHQCFFFQIEKKSITGLLHINELNTHKWVSKMPKICFFCFFFDTRKNLKKNPKFQSKFDWIWRIIEFSKKFISKFHQIEIIIIYSKFSFMIWKFHQI